MKRVLSLVLALLIVFTVSGCKKSGESGSNYETSEYYYYKTVEEAGEKSEETDKKDGKVQSKLPKIEQKSDDESSATDATSKVIATQEDIDNCKNGRHRYSTATCTEPAKCMYCGATTGKANGHTFIDNAICIVCGAHGSGWKNWYTENNYEITRVDVDSIISQKFVKPKNVIVMIGDGMGPNDIEIAQKYSKDKYTFGLILNRFKNTGFAVTRSLNSDVTDSAASATALATGSKTNNGIIGMSPTGDVLENVSEVARKCGKKVGIVTNDAIVGATPSGFTVHNKQRTDAAGISKSFVDFAPDVLIGQGAGDFGKYNLSNICVSYSDIDINTVLNTDNNCTKPYFGFFNEDVSAKLTSSLATYAEVALNRLKNDNGFFLMIENAGTDFAGHNQDIFGKVNNVVTFDRTIAVVLKFMRENPDTLLIITSDHDNGGVKLPDMGKPLTKDLFTSSGHTGIDVRTFALGYGAEYFNGTTVDNTDIAKFVKKALKGEW